MERQRDKYMLSPPQQQDSVCQTETPSKTLFGSATPVWERAGITPFTFQLQALSGPDKGSPRGPGRGVGWKQVLDVKP